MVSALDLHSSRWHGRCERVVARKRLFIYIPMSHQKLFLQLLSDDIRALHSSALTLEKGIHRLSNEIESHSIDSLAGLIAQINCTGFAPIEEMLRFAGVDMERIGRPADPETGVMVEAEAIARGNRRVGAAEAISSMRRAARYMEMSCATIADAAMRLRLTDLADHLRAWAREWIGLELNLNAVAARPREGALAFAAA